METETTSKPKSIREAVADGSLVDITDMAKSIGIPCPTFIPPSLIEKTNARAPFDLRSDLFAIAVTFEDYGAYNVLGGQDQGDRFQVLEPHEEFGGRVLLIIEKDLNIERTTPNSPTRLN